MGREFSGMPAEHRFKNEMNMLRQQFGWEAEARLYLVMAAVAKWVRDAGHGNVTLSAVNHILGQKIRIETIITAKGD